MVCRNRQGREQAVKRASDHALDDRSHRCCAVGEFLHALAIAKNDDPVGYSLDLFHAVGNVDDADAI